MDFGGGWVSRRKLDQLRQDQKLSVCLRISGRHVWRNRNVYS